MGSPSATGAQPAVLATARALTIDRVTAEVVDTLRHGGIESVLLKGPVLLRRLYPSGASRPYNDIDLLIDVRDRDAATRLLAARGYARDAEDGRFVPDWQDHSDNWLVSSQRVLLELHWNLIHVGAPERLWAAFTRAPVPMSIGGIEVSTPGDLQLALLVALHAAQHGAGWDRPQADLAAALEKFPAATWREAAALASELRATDAFSTGLRLVEAGRGVARRLRLPERRSVEVSLTAWGAPGHVKALTAVMRASGWRSKVRVLLRLAVPSPESLRNDSSLARRGLAAAYVVRWSRMLRHGLPALRVLLRARRHESVDG